MKKRFRLISLLLACLLLANLFVSIPHANACEEGEHCLNPDYDPHPEFRTDDTDNGKFGYLNRNVQVYDTITNEWVQLNKGCKVKILVKVYMDDKWTYTVEFGRIYTDVPINAIDWTKPANPEKVERHGTLNRNVQAYSSVRKQMEQLDSGCWVNFVSLDVSDEYTYTITFGSYGTYTGVPINSVDWDDGYSPFETNSKKENSKTNQTTNKESSKSSSTAKNEEPQKNPSTQKVTTNTKQVKVCIADRYRFFTGTYWERQLFKGNTAMAIAFGEMHMYMK